MKWHTAKTEQLLNYYSSRCIVVDNVKSSPKVDKYEDGNAPFFHGPHDVVDMVLIIKYYL